MRVSIHRASDAKRPSEAELIAQGLASLPQGEITDVLAATPEAQAEEDAKIKGAADALHQD